MCHLRNTTAQLSTLQSQASISAQKIDKHKKTVKMLPLLMLFPLFIFMFTWRSFVERLFALNGIEMRYKLCPSNSTRTIEAEWESNRAKVHSERGQQITLKYQGRIVENPQ